jgi:CPA1 family monovalent cation:H+ antiporter
MQIVYLLLVLFLFAIGLSWAARRLKLPYPIALVLGGTALGFVPLLPSFTFDPNLVLVIVLPPILYSAAFFTSWAGFPPLVALHHNAVDGLGAGNHLRGAAVAHHLIGLLLADGIRAGRHRLTSGRGRRNQHTRPHELLRRVITIPRR